MNRQEYLSELERALRSARVADCDEILEEYGEHFEMKLRDGYSEDEIAARLAPPKELAAQYESGGADGRGVFKAIVTAGLVLCDFFVGSFFLLLYSWCLVMGSMTLAFALGGLGMFFRAAVPPSFLSGIVNIPPMPVVCMLLLGVSLLAVAVLSAIGTEYCWRYTTQLMRVYVRWHRGVLSGTPLSPPMPKYPSISAKKRRMTRTVALVALVFFAVFLVAGFASMVIAARSFEPWHVWGWFVP